MGGDVRTQISALRGAGNPLPYVRQGVTDLGAAWQGGGPQAFTAKFLGQHELADEVLRAKAFNPEIVTEQIRTLNTQGAVQRWIGAGGMATGSLVDGYQSGSILQVPGLVGTLATDVVGEGRALLDGR